jgi:CheY-like chemotaxis protein
VHTTALLVNVHKPDQDTLQHLLVQAGYDVLRSKSGEEALELCRDYKRRIHLLVTRTNMPGSSGWELAEHATALRPGIVILYLPETLPRGSPSKASLLFDVTQALIHATHQKLQ